MGYAQPQQHPVTANPSQVWNGQFTGEDQVTLVNNDKVNTVFLGNVPQFSQTANSVILKPNSTVTVSARKPWFVSGPVGTLNITVIPGSIQFQTGVAIAASVFQNGVSFAVGPGGTAVRGPFDVSGFNSLNISVTDLLSSVTSVTANAALTANIQFSFADAAGNQAGIVTVAALAVFTNMAATTVATYATIPCLGDNVTVSVTNNGTVGTLTIPLGGFTITSSFRQTKTRYAYYITGAGWNGTNIGVTPLVSSDNNFTPFGMVPTSYWVQNVNVNVTNTGSSLFLCQGFCGAAAVEWEVVTNVLTNNPVLVDLSFATTSTLIFGGGNQGVIQEYGNTLNQLEFHDVNLPAAPCALIAHGAVGGSSLLYTVVAKES